MPGTATRGAPRGDRRSRRTRQAILDAFVQLMLEKRYDELSVQEIIDRANVGRSTFYSHFLDKEDLLRSLVDQVVATLVSHMDAGAGKEGIIPSLQLLQHFKESHVLIQALIRGRAIEPVLEMMRGRLSTHVADRLASRMPATREPAIPLPLVAQHVVGTLLTLFQWWFDRDMVESPEQVDAYFMALVRPSVREITGIDV